jgi:ribosomal protein S18 acetylase RimI-like enzyme
MPSLAPPYAVRHATPEDRAFLSSLNTRSYRELVIRQFGAWDEAEQDAKFADKWRRGVYWIVTRGETPVGGVMIEEFPDHLFIGDVQIDGPEQGQGLGGRLSASIVAETIARRPLLRLRVLHRNPARALYERLGFREYAITETHYLMEKTPDPA